MNRGHRRARGGSQLGPCGWPPPPSATAIGSVGSTPKMEAYEATGASSSSDDLADCGQPPAVPGDASRSLRRERRFLKPAIVIVASSILPFRGLSHLESPRSRPSAGPWRNGPLLGGDGDR